MMIAAANAMSLVRNSVHQASDLWALVLSSTHRVAIVLDWAPGGAKTSFANEASPGRLVSREWSPFERETQSRAGNGGETVRNQWVRRMVSSLPGADTGLSTMLLVVGPWIRSSQDDTL